MKPSNFQHRRIVFSAHTLHLETTQENEGRDQRRSRTRPRPGHKLMTDPDLPVSAGEFNHGELEVVQTARERYRQ